MLKIYSDINKNANEKYYKNQIVKYFKKVYKLSFARV